ncbi:cyclin-dependent kinase 2-interacting protein-like [Zootermopsis nevadensis]|uniref:Cyclin-dependent kinase 2-interacting protein n=1 Tax=Zootermopsis nevadensis TaxID=136037 RepID=A0A067RBU2_ZOONE|nr:cyclin-dependent kinase 2-interacting protein-like [Zootermopsis nevadensis]KDR21356.1 Cyclin-dependent kinase 2-interacting protein [Zootermopsis nevadensis]
MEPTLYSPSFSFVTVKESPVKKILQCGNLTGNARRVRDAAADFHNLIQEWNVQHLLGVQILNTVMAMKLPVLIEVAAEGSSQIYPEGLEAQCEQLDEVIQVMNKIVGQLQTVAQQMHSVEKLEKLQNTNKTPMFLTWSSDRYGKVSDEIYEAYRLELIAKNRVKNNIAHCCTKEALMYHTATWVHQPYIDSNVDLLLESILHETGHR